LGSGPCGSAYTTCTAAAAAGVQRQPYKLLSNSVDIHHMQQQELLVQ
jgi:hypothetical protein